jgi:hypothetical protein
VQTLGCPAAAAATKCKQLLQQPSASSIQLRLYMMIESSSTVLCMKHMRKDEKYIFSAIEHAGA